MATEKQINCISDFAAILEQQFVNGFYDGRLPIVVYDPYGVKICEINAGDPTKWVKTPYEQSYASSQRLCSRKRWESMSIIEQVSLCDCWYELAIAEYLDPAYDAGVDFEIEDS
jgi:hypothetical protein